jgi:hypothetical protein
MASEVSDRMPGSNFDRVLVLKDGRISPTGALEIEDDETIIRLYVWIIQVHNDGTSAACIAFQEDWNPQSRKTWATRADAIHEGEFRPGQAFATAISVSRVQASSIWSRLATPARGSTRTYWWSELVLIVEDGETPSATA